MEAYVFVNATDDLAVGDGGHGVSGVRGGDGPTAATGSVYARWVASLAGWTARRPTVREVGWCWRPFFGAVLSVVVGSGSIG